MQKHEDLRAARLIADLSQAQAASKAGVSREHFTRMETGKRSLPESTYLKFLEAVALTQTDVDAYFATLPAAAQPPSRQITEATVEDFLHSLPRAKAEALCASILRKHPQPAPVKLEYDRMGYPLNVGPFDAVEFNGTHDWDIDQALIEIEGRDYPALERTRRVKYTERRWPNNKDEDHLQERAKAMRKWDADNAWFFAKTALDNGWPVADEEKARALVKDHYATKAAEEVKARIKAEQEAKRDAERKAQQEAQRKLEADPEYQAKKKADEAAAKEDSRARAEQRMRAAKYGANGYPQEYPFADWEAAQGNLRAMLDYDNGLAGLEGPYYTSMCERRETLRKARLARQERIRQLEEEARLRRLEDEELA